MTNSVVHISEDQYKIIKQNQLNTNKNKLNSHNLHSLFSNKKILKNLFNLNSVIAVPSYRAAEPSDFPLPRYILEAVHSEDSSTMQFGNFAALVPAPSLRNATLRILFASAAPSCWNVHSDSEPSVRYFQEILALTFTYELQFRQNYFQYSLPIFDNGM